MGNTLEKKQETGNRKQLTGYLIGTIAVFAVAFLAYSDDQRLNPFFFIGFVSLILLIFLVQARIYSKTNFKRKLKEAADRFEAIQMDCVYEFSEKSVRYQDLEKKLEFNWSLFSSYTIYKGFLKLDSASFDFFLFEKEVLPIGEYEKLLEWVEAKVG